jgi:hypothetical protein
MKGRRVENPLSQLENVVVLTGNRALSYPGSELNFLQILYIDVTSIVATELITLQTLFVI